MKIRIVLFCLMAAITVSNAQVSLDINDCPSPGLELNVTEYYNDVLDLNDSVDVGTSGANGVYDFTAITNFVGSSEVVEYITPSQTGWSSEHPNSNLAILEGIDVDSASGDTFVIEYTYYHVDDDGCSEMGISLLIDTGFVLSQTSSGNLIEVHLDFSPGGNHMNTSYQMGYSAMDTSYWEVNIGDLYHNEAIIRDVFVDGWGQLSTPDGMVDALRVKIIEYDINYTEVNGNEIENEADTSYYYEFWTNDVGEAVITAEMSQSWTIIYDVEYTTVAKAGSGYATAIDESQDLSIAVFPNPADDRLNIAIQPDNISIDIYNILGDKILSFEPANQETTIDVSGLQNGVYLMNISRGSSVLRTEKVIINH